MAIVFPPQFLDDLDLAHKTLSGGGLSRSFCEDLEVAAAAAAETLRRDTITQADLEFLATALRSWRLSNRERLQRYLDRLAQDDPIRLPVSLFGTMDYGRLETAHTRTLAWLLGKGKAEHGFGFRLLDALLSDLQDTKISVVGSPVVEGEYYIDPDRIDVFAEGKWEANGESTSWCLVIEAKIDAEEGYRQLSRYDEWLEKKRPDCEKIRVFLTPEGKISSEAKSGRWKSLSFASLAGVFRREMLTCQDRPGYHYLRYYLAGILRDVCGFPIPIHADCANPYLANDYLKLTPERQALDKENRNA
jgi:PD-(D/E)XK nuclease superfamily